MSIQNPGSPVRSLPIEPTNFRAAIGARLRAARQAQRLTMEQVATVTGLSKGFISRVERDLTSPSVTTLVKLCEVLNIEIGDVFVSSDVEYVAGEDAPRINLGGRGVVERLLTPRRESRLQAIRSSITATGSGGDELYTVNSAVDFVHVISGSVTLEFSDRSWSLQAGDSLTFDGREPHNWHADGDAGAALLWVLAPAAWNGTS